MKVTSEKEKVWVPIIFGVTTVGCTPIRLKKTFVVSRLYLKSPVI